MYYLVCERIFHFLFFGVPKSCLEVCMRRIKGKKLQILNEAPHFKQYVYKNLFLSYARESINKLS